MLAHANLARYAGRFVWLELNYDKAENRAFLTKYGAYATPTFFIIDPRDGVVAASQTGAMSLEGLEQFLDRGSRGVLAKKQTPADAAVARGDALLAPKPTEAAEAYREALRLAPADWPRRELAETSLTVALRYSHQWRECAEAAATAAEGMRRDAMFGRTLVAGMWCLDSADPAPWSKEQAGRLEPLAKEALSLPTTLRDHRNELYRTLMLLSLSRKDEPGAAKWGDRWLAELDAIKPRDDDERSAGDIARVENVEILGDPKRVLPALLASESAMPNNWNASLRVAQMETEAQDYDEAVAACDRGLSRAPGPAGRSWLLQTKSAALRKKGKPAEARRALEEALQAAKEIPSQTSRENNLRRIHAGLAPPAPQR